MAFGFLSKLLSAKSYLGVDIGTTSIKAVDLKKSGGKPELRGYCFLESHSYLQKMDAATQFSDLKTMDETTVEYLKKAVEGVDTNSRDVIASVPAFSAFTTLIETPIMSSADTAKAMEFQIKQYVPMPLSEVTTDWVKVAEKKSEGGQSTQQVLLVTMPNDIINKFKDIFQKAELNLIGLEVDGLSLARSLTINSPDASLILDIGSRSSSILVAQNGFLKFLSQTDFASGSLTQNIASGLNLPVEQAEELKRQKGITNEYELSTLLLPVLDAIINEGKAVKESFEQNYKEKIKRVILAGGGANLVGADKYFAEQFGLPASRANPFSVINYPVELEPLIKELNPVFAIAIGLAMRNM